MELLSKEKRRIITNVKFILGNEKVVPYISPKGYSIMDIELLYYAIKKATLPDLELFKRTGHMPFSNGYIDIPKKD